VDINITLTIQLAPALEKLIGAALGAAPAIPATTQDRPTQAIAAAPATPQSGTPASDTPASSDPDGTGPTATTTASPSKGGRKKAEPAPAAADPFATKTAAAAPVEAQPSTPTASSVEPAADVTLPMVQAAMSSWLNTSGNTALGLKTLFEANFKKADGAPAAKLSDLQPKDYAAVIAKLS
jgi:hypothetical protein